MKDIVKKIITDFHQGELTNFIKRDLRVPVDLRKIISIIGPRRAGKTFYLFQLIKQLEEKGIQRNQILYINFEDERLELEGNYDLLVESYMELYPELDLSKSYFFFDEIQELKHWEKYVRRIYDTVTKNIFLTGSNSKFLSTEIATSLRGRTISFEIMPLSFREYLRFKDIDASKIYSSREQATIQNAFEEYLFWGGYPELVNFNVRFKTQVLQEYFNVMIYRDLVERYGISDVSLLKYIMKRLMSTITKEFSVNKLFNELKSRGIAIGKNSVYKLIDQIFSIYMMTYVEKYESSVIKREMSNKKVYLFDNGIASANRYSIFKDRGKLLENLVFNHLRKTNENLFFLKNRWECDFLIVNQDRQLSAIQVTEYLSHDNYDRELKGLEAVRNRFDNPDSLLLVSTVDPSIIIPDWCNSMQVWEWLLTSSE